MKISKFGDVLSKLVQLNRFKDGGLGAELPASGSFGALGAKPPAAGKFWKKKAFLMTLDHISQVFRAISKN